MVRTPHTPAGRLSTFTAEMPPCAGEANCYCSLLRPCRDAFAFALHWHLDLVPRSWISFAPHWPVLASHLALILTTVFRYLKLVSWIL